MEMCRRVNRKWRNKVEVVFSRGDCDFCFEDMVARVRFHGGLLLSGGFKVVVSDFFLKVVRGEQVGFVVKFERFGLEG